TDVRKDVSLEPPLVMGGTIFFDASTAHDPALPIRAHGRGHIDASENILTGLDPRFDSPQQPLSLVLFTHLEARALGDPFPSAVAEPDGELLATYVDRTHV